MQEKDLTNHILAANRKVYAMEAPHYERIHQDIFDPREQHRIRGWLRTVDRLIERNAKRALDVGAGTGNITGKLLQLGYRVTAVDVSPEMCVQLQKTYASAVSAGQLTIRNADIGAVEFSALDAPFDLIAGYAVLHHLPNYLGVIRSLSPSLKTGGVMYFDRDPSLFTFHPMASRLSRVLSRLPTVIDRLYPRMHRSVRPPDSEPRALDPSVYASWGGLCDYWTAPEHPLDHKQIGRLFQEEAFARSWRKDYYIFRRRMFAPFFRVYQHFVKPELSLWVAQK